MVHFIFWGVCLSPPQSYNSQCVLSDGQPLSGDQGACSAGPVGGQQDKGDGKGDLYLVPSTVKLHTFTFVPQQTDVGQTLEVSDLSWVFNSG